MKMRCEQCGETLTIFGQQPGTPPKFCGSACRQRAYRARKKLAEKTAEVTEMMADIYPGGAPAPAAVSLAEQLDAIREKVRAEERARFEEKLAALDVKREQEKARELERIEEKRAAELKKLEERYTEWWDEFNRVRKELEQERSTMFFNAKNPAGRKSARKSAQAIANGAAS